MLSSTPVTVIVCGAFQLSGVKVTLAGLTIPSLVLLLDSPTTTLAVGGRLSTMVNVAICPFSLVQSPTVGLIVKPAVSLSMLVTVTSGGSIPAKFGSLLAALDVSIV